MEKFTIIKVQPHELDQYRNIIVDLWKNNLSEGSCERFNWLYRCNPCGQAVTWLARDNQTGDFVGCNSLYPLKINISGKTFTMGIAIDFAVSKLYRVFGPALLIEKCIVKEAKLAGFDMIFAWPSSASLGVFVRAGYRKLGDVFCWTKPVCSLASIQRYIQNPHISKFLSIIIDAYFIGLDSFLNLGSRVLFDVELLTSCDVRFDSIDFRKKSTPYLRTLKSKDFLNWRYRQRNCNRYLFYCLVNKRDRSVCAFVVFTIENDIVLIWDVVALGSRQLLGLIASFSIEMRKRKISNVSLCYFGNKTFERVLKLTGFFRRNIKRPCVFSISEDLETGISEHLLKKENWNIIDGDMDL